MSDKICEECNTIMTNKKRTAKFCSVRCYRLNIKPKNKESNVKENNETKRDSEVTIDITMDFLTCKLEQIIENQLNNIIIPKIEELKTLIEKYHNK